MRGILQRIFPPAIVMKNYTLPPRPPLLPVTGTYIYKTVGNVSLALDLHLPSETRTGKRHPIALFIHGGGWMAGTRRDYSRPLFQRLLDAGFVVTTMDYRLLPESSLDEQLSDVKDVQAWLRTQLPLHVHPAGLELAVDTIIVIGGSAGAHLALMTPTLWSPAPTAILSLYGPTNMHTLPYLHRGRLHSLQIPPPTQELLAAATDYARPPTETRLPSCAADDLRPRTLMALHVFRRSIIAELMLRGLRSESSSDQDADEGLKLPRKGCVTAEEIDAISPLSLAFTHAYPPIYQIMGTIDSIFETTHLTSFQAALDQVGVHCTTVLVPRQDHAFDIWAEAGGDVDVEVLRPAVEWMKGLVRENA